MDYIYQGPIILVLLVGPQCELGWGWAPGGLRRTHHRGAGEGCGLEQQPPCRPQLCTQYHTAWLSVLCFPTLYTLLQPRSPLWPLGSFSGQRVGLTGRFLVSLTSDIPLPGSVLRQPGGGRGGNWWQEKGLQDLVQPRPTSPSTRRDLLQGSAHRPQPGAVGPNEAKHNEQLFLTQLPTLCQKYSHLRYNCSHVSKPQRALIKVEFK